MSKAFTTIFTLAVILFGVTCAIKSLTVEIGLPFLLWCAGFCIVLVTPAAYFWNRFFTDINKPQL